MKTDKLLVCLVKLYNTETKTKTEFVPIDPSNVTVYVCGPTVWNHAHIGNYRPPVVFDILTRVLRSQFQGLTYARNITDIDDKINKAAAEQDVDISVISERYTEFFHQGLEALGVLPPDVEPKVTHHMQEIHNKIQVLIDGGHAYEADGHVLFDVPSYAGYGELSRRDPDELLAGARIDVASYKKNDGDFVLWKPSSEEQPGWDSPWGRGRPGWHIECTAMAAAHLGETIDIHGGGHDLVFPHHENERAQSFCAHGLKFVNHWMHNGFVNVNKEKMSKSIGNVLLVRDLLEQTSGEAIRYVLLSTHYRVPLEWNDKVLQQANNSLDRFYGALRKMSHIKVPGDIGDQKSKGFVDAMLDDLNVPKAMAELFVLVKQANTTDSESELIKIKASLLQSGEWLGLFQQDPDAWFSSGAEGVDGEQIDALIAERLQAKADKNWERADQIRDFLSDNKIVVEDGANGTTWRVEK